MKLNPNSKPPYNRKPNRTNPRSADGNQRTCTPSKIPQNSQHTRTSLANTPVIRRRKRSMTKVYIARAVLAAIIIAVLIFIIWGVNLIVGIISGEKSDTHNNSKDNSKQPDISADTAPETYPPFPENPDATEPDISDASADTESPGKTNYAYTFKADLSEYEKYMNPENTDEYLTLINKTHTLEENYIPDDLADIVDTRSDGRDTQQLRLYAEKALEAFLIEGRENGVTNVSVTSGYRSYAKQSSLFNGYLKQYSYMGEQKAYDYVTTFSAIPGTSEHQSGLCVDMHNLSSADISFGDTPEAKWLADNCYKFGFILRFPADKTDITEISYEPWHFRYVGRYHASEIHSSGLCLEEYMESADS